MRHDSCSRKFDKNVAAAAAANKKQKGGTAEEAGGKPVVKGKIQVGEFVEVKWGVDWWHAQVNFFDTSNSLVVACVPTAAGRPHILVD